MNKITLRLAAASIATVAGGMVLTHVSSHSLSVATAESVGLEGRSDTRDTIELAEPVAVEAQKVDAIAKTYSHKISDRSATTVYVRNIPVATFLAELDESAAEAEPAPGSSVEPQVVNASQEFVKAINQLDQDGVDAQTIGVKWDTTSKQYVIHVAQTPLIAMNGNVILPSTTKDKAEDALQITNRLRRQIGNVKPLKKIEGQPPRPVKKVAVAPTNVRRYQQGWASWYGPGFHGNLTADGTRYNQFGLTAAHRTLPFGTRLRVTNQNNGRSVVVVVNDRGPFIHNRVIDLSMGAAQVLGVINSGVAPVTLDILR